MQSLLITTCILYFSVCYVAANSIDESEADVLNILFSNHDDQLLNTRDKRHTYEELATRAENDAWKTEYYNFLLEKRRKEISKEKLKKAKFHKDRQDSLKRLLKDVKAEKERLLHPKRKQPIAAAPPVHKVRSYAGREPTQSDEVKKVNIRVPSTLHYNLRSFFDKYNGTSIELNDDEIVAVEDSPDVKQIKDPKYLTMEIPESLYHRMWRFFKKYALRIPETPAPTKEVEKPKTAASNESKVTDEKKDAKVNAISEAAKVEKGAEESSNESSDTKVKDSSKKSTDDASKDDKQDEAESSTAADEDETEETSGEAGSDEAAQLVDDDEKN